MDDLISRQAALNETWREPRYTDPLNVLTEVRERIRSLPSAQQEIIRCKDCKHYQEDFLFRIGFCDGRQRNNDDFCSRAERIDNG